MSSAWRSSCCDMRCWARWAAPAVVCISASLHSRVCELSRCNWSTIKKKCYYVSHTCSGHTVYSLTFSTFSVRPEIALSLSLHHLRTQCARGPVSTVNDGIFAWARVWSGSPPGPCLYILWCGQGRLIINHPPSVPAHLCGLILNSQDLHCPSVCPLLCSTLFVL